MPKSIERMIIHTKRYLKNTKKDILASGCSFLYCRSRTAKKFKNFLKLVLTLMQINSIISFVSSKSAET